MPNKIKPKRSYTANSVPLTTDLETHELAINWVDNKAFTKDASGNIVSVTLGGSGGGGGSDSRWDLFLPAAPTSVTASASNAQATVSWTAPTGVLSQTPITDYRVQYQPSGGSWTTFSRSASTATSATVTGLTNGTAYTFRVAAVNGVGTGAYSAASNAVTPNMGDPYFSNVALLLTMDGSGSTFVDSSPTPKTVAALGNATQSATQSKFGGKSAYFAASGDCLRIEGVNIGTGDFVIEMWIKTASDVRYAQLIGNEAAGNEGFTLLINNDSSTGGQIALYRGTVGFPASSGDLSDDAWHYIALSRSGSTLRLYLDGALAFTGDSSTSFSSSSDMYVAYNNRSSPRNLVGYIDELRITVGENRGYTGSTITVPTQAFPSS